MPRLNRYDLLAGVILVNMFLFLGMYAFIILRAIIAGLF